MDRYSEFLELIRVKIKIEEMKQKDIAKALNISESQLSKILSGDQGMDFNMIFDFMDLFNINPLRFCKINTSTTYLMEVAVSDDDKVKLKNVLRKL